MKSATCVLLAALTAALLARPLLASASSADCKFSEPRTLKLDTSGVKTVMFQVHSNHLKLNATPGENHQLTGKACASNQALLGSLILTQQRVGDKLIVNLSQQHSLNIFLGQHYAYLDLTGSVPSNVLVQLDVGSGEASLSGAKAASADVGSGDVDLRDISGLLTTRVGSGDLKFTGVGALKVLWLASGNILGSAIANTAQIGGIASGELRLKQIGGGVELNSVSSGDAELEQVTGDVTVNSVGSGDLRVRDVNGDLTVHRVGSGEIQHHGVTGSVNIPKQD